MNHNLPLILIVLVAIFGTSTANAKNRSGFAHYGGLSAYSLKGEFTEGFFNGQNFEITGNGLSIGLDYKFALGDNFSAHVALMDSSQNADSDEINIDRMAHGLFGVQGRYWFNRFYIGGMVSSFGQILFKKADDTVAGSKDEKVRAVGPGASLLFGWEAENGILVGLQYDYAKLKYDDSEITAQGIRIHGGYRFHFNWP